MRVSSRDLVAVQRGGMLARYALMGPVAFVHVDIPATGTAGTGLDDRCLTDHHGIVIRGALTVHFDDDRPSATFSAGAAFYVPPGPPSHHFTSAGETRVAGFSAVSEGLDLSAEAIARLGLEPVSDASSPLSLPPTVRVEGGDSPFRRRGSVDVEGSVMGRWLFMRSVLGPESGFTSGRCEVPHWGLVLHGDLAIYRDEDIDLVTAGDAFYTPPGHRFESSDGATIVDYTPLVEIESKEALPAWRRRAIERITLPQVSDAESPAPVTDPSPELGPEPGPASGLHLPGRRGPISTAGA